MSYGNGYSKSDWGLLSLPSILKLRPVDEVLMEATVKNRRIDGIRVEVCRRIGMFEQAFVKWLQFFNLIALWGQDVLSDWGTSPP